jgi:amino-acid N-acetyltransferase
LKKHNLSAEGGCAAKHHIRSAEFIDLQQIVEFLKVNGLPTVGVESWYANFVIATDERGTLLGVADLEIYGQIALLRSVAVEKDSRRMGHGRALVDAVLTNAKQNGVDTIYLLTETASDYFKHLGFDFVDRKDIDEAVTASLEFTECRSTALAMRKTI